MKGPTTALSSKGIQNAGETGVLRGGDVRAGGRVSWRW